MRWDRRVWLVAAIAVAMALPAGADVIFDNGGPNATEGFYSDSGFSSQTMADDFMLAPGASTITDIHWWGTYGTFFGLGNTPPTSDVFSLYLYSDVSGLPGTPLVAIPAGAVSRTDTGLVGTRDGLSIYEYEVGVPGIALAPSTPYWLSIVNATTDPDNRWAWSMASPTGVFVFGDAGLNWSGATGELAFRLTGEDDSSVPEPASMTLLGLGLAATALGRRLRARKA